MNLLVEQRLSSIPSSSKSQTPSSPLSDQNDMNNSSSTATAAAAASSLVLKIKRQAAREQQHGSDSSSTSSRMAEDDGEQEEDTADTSNHSRSSSQMQRSTKRPNSNSTVRRPSSPAFNGKQASKRSVTIDNNNNDLPSHLEESSRTKRFKSNDSNVRTTYSLSRCRSDVKKRFLASVCFMKQSSSSKVDASVETVSVGLATEPDHLGPCEPVCYISFNLISSR
jgi:hypothetical protein